MVPTVGQAFQLWMLRAKRLAIQVVYCLSQSSSDRNHVSAVVAIRHEHSACSGVDYLRPINRHPVVVFPYSGPQPLSAFLRW